MLSGKLAKNAGLLSSLLLTTGLLVAQGQGHGHGHGQGGPGSTPNAPDQPNVTGSGANIQTDHGQHGGPSESANQGANAQADNTEHGGHGRNHGRGQAGNHGDSDGTAATTQTSSAGPSQRPPGWDKGKKVGWGNCDVPPGLAKKSGCGATLTGQPATLGDAARAQRDRRTQSASTLAPSSSSTPSGKPVAPASSTAAPKGDATKAGGDVTRDQNGGRDRKQRGDRPLAEHPQPK